MRRVDVPEVVGVLTADDIVRSAESIAAVQQRSGAIPWSPTGHTDPWDHVESAMALSVGGLREEAERAYDWMRREQRPDGSWPMQYRGDVVEDAGSDTNFCAYVAVGVWHHFSMTHDDAFLARMWPTVAAAIDFVLDFQSDRGEIAWAAGPKGRAEAALLTGSSSIFHSLRCAVAMAEHLADARGEWELSADRLGDVLRDHEHAFVTKSSHSMDWYYPILAGALRGGAAETRIDRRWDDFVVDGLGVRCVDHQPWVTGAETCELVMALDAIGRREQAVEQFANMQHLRDPDGAYWTGLVYSDGKRWPVERTTWTTAAVILAADVLSGATPGSEIFR